MSLLSAAVSSSANSQSINSGSLVFQPVISLDSPEASIRQSPDVDTSTRFSDTSSSSTARARATISSGLGGEDEEGGGFIPRLSLGSGGRTADGGPSMLAGDLTPGGGGGRSPLMPWVLIGAIGFAAYFLFKRVT